MNSTSVQFGVRDWNQTTFFSKFMFGKKNIVIYEVYFDGSMSRLIPQESGMVECLKGVPPEAPFIMKMMEDGEVIATDGGIIITTSDYKLTLEKDSLISEGEIEVVGKLEHFDAGTSDVRVIYSESSSEGVPLI